MDASAQNVVWHGFVARQELINDILPSMDVFVLASRTDMLPWAALEAAAIGLPIVAPRVGGIPEVAVNGHCGLLFEPDDDEGLARALETLIADASLRERMGRSARQHITENFDPDRTYTALLDRLVALADGPQEAPATYLSPTGVNSS